MATVTKNRNYIKWSKLLYFEVMMDSNLNCISIIMSFLKGTGYEYDGYVFVAWVLQVRRAEVVTNDQPVSGHGPLFYGN